MVNKIKALVVSGILVSGSFAATHASAAFVSGGVSSISSTSLGATADANGSAIILAGGSHLSIKPSAKGGNGKGRPSSSGGNGSSSGNNGSSSSSSGGGSVPAPGPLLLILGMLGVAVMRRRNS